MTWVAYFFSLFQTFEGNVNSEGVVRQEFQHTILARYIRFIPVDWSREGRIGVRLELHGCSYCEFLWMREKTYSIALLTFGPSNYRIYSVTHRS